MDVRSLFATALSYTIEEPVGPCSSITGRWWALSCGHSKVGSTGTGGA
jgi:hypothetical protein